MRTLALAVAASALLVATHANAANLPVNRMAGVSGDLVDQVAVRVYVHAGHRYCFYFNGWHGPGWYRCGFAFRRGYGWGGVYGWNDWSYGPYERRYGGARMGVETHSRSTTTTGSTIKNGNRSGTMSGNVQTRSRSTTGSGSGVNVQGGSGANVQGGANVQQRGRRSGDTNVQGGASVGGSAGMSEQKKQ